MKRSGKNLGDAHQPVAVVATSERADPHCRKRKAGVGVGLSLQRELLRQFLPQYHEGSLTQKQVVLADFIRLTGYHRKYAISLLNQRYEKHKNCGTAFALCVWSRCRSSIGTGVGAE